MSPSTSRCRLRNVCTKSAFRSDSQKIEELRLLMRLAVTAIRSRYWSFMPNSVPTISGSISSAQRR